MITYKKQNSKRNIEQEFSHEIREGEMVTLPDGTTISVKKRIELFNHLEGQIRRNSNFACTEYSTI